MRSKPRLIFAILLIVIGLFFAACHSTSNETLESYFETIEPTIATIFTTPSTEPSTIPETTSPVYLDFEPGERYETYISESGVYCGYYIHIPKNMTADMPLIVWLCGQDEVGNGWLVKNTGVIKAAKAIDEERFVILQPLGNDYDSTMELIDTVVEKYSVDETRVILTGNSLGGLLTWDWAERDPDRWAAVVPVSNKPIAVIDNLLTSDVAVWAFWSDWDVDSNRYGMKAGVEALIESGTHAEVRWTEVTHIHHNDMAWYPYDQEFFDWAVEKRRKRVNESEVKAYE